MSASLPDGFTVRIRDDIRVADSGRTLVGGTPLRAVRFTDRAATIVEDGVVEVCDKASRVLVDRLLDADLAVPILGAAESCTPDDLTVVIPVRDRAQELERLLSALRPTLRCIVVDDASHDPAAVANVVKRLGAQLVVLEQNVGPAGARNAGLREVSTPLVAFVDSDVMADPDVLLRLGAHFADPRLALVAPLVKGRAPSDQPRWFQKYDEIASSLDLGGKASGVRPGGAVAWLPGACLVARVDAIGKGFDDQMRVGEDVDFVWRLTDKGWRVRYDPDFVVDHETRSTVRTWLGRKFVYGTGGAALAQRHGDLVAPAVLSPTYAAAAIALLAQRPWSIGVALAAVARAGHVLNHTLPETPARSRLAAQLATDGLVWMARQESALILRHWWPAAAAAAMFSPRARRAVLVAAVVDLASYWPHRSSIGPVSYVVARRLDDLAYGAGLWTGAVRARSTKALRVRLIRRRTR
ncbi:mycofactocin system glycosyltransferase [Kribbella sp. VKM Ac-2527]|uniref:Mycofactocin system glycosyltransferase n=1 Tax=Kribbella caucasensis TaxID=2512215 RepID=A0A4R6KKS1_9ACTN|nr:mycofactocin biosynthesis glycosyltransferase MftF [Kribbella sp. VKM Ac-2527]TDO51773.1 mycofactocin system glycosyltransferase [Kribbella sp. VKM Ac-2527]